MQDPVACRRLALATLFLLASAAASAQAPLPREAPGGFEVRMEADATEYRIGELMRLRVKSERTGYLMLYVLDAAGQAQVLVPGPFSDYDRVYAGQSLEIRDSRGRLLRQQGPAGVETVQAVVTRARLPATRFAGLGAEALARAVEAELTALPDRTHGQAVVHYSVTE